MKNCPLAISIFFFTFCASSQTYGDSLRCEKSIDEYNGTINIKVSTDTKFDQNPGQVTVIYEKSNEIDGFALGTFWVFDRWKHLGEEAFDIDRNKLRVKALPGRVMAPNAVLEVVQIVVTMDYLESHRDSGIKVRIYGDAGNEDFTVDATHVDAFINCFESHSTSQN
jgi:hypothetical protein